MNTIIELHDSTVATIDGQLGEMIVHFRPAYLHKSQGRPGNDAGTGWVQEARLIFGDASVNGEIPDLPCDIMDGALTIDGELHDNHIPMPLDSEAHAELRLVFDSVHAVTVTGRGVRLQLSGEPEYVEEFRP
ncbi:MAG: hypothetical protein J0M24_05030 [Verrucomicrobia bacterium]|nr:hypothetical protein [Verrucomicrobiota bacterium]